MLYIFHGNDREKINIKAQELMASLSAKRPDASLFNLNPDNWSTDLLNEYTESQGLFVQKYIINAQDIFSQFFNEAGDYIERIKESPHIFIFREYDLDAKKIKALTKYADKIQEFEKVEKKDDYNIFGIANAWGDKKKLWTLYQEAKLRDIADEQIHGILFWKLKSINAPQIGSLVDVYHEARRGGDMELLLERWILTV